MRATERPLLGHGAGSYEYLWYERRPTQLVIRDAHSLYAEMFAELGLVGVVLLGLALLAPLVAAVRARREPGRSRRRGRVRRVAAAHAGMDWHWEVVGVTMIALLAGAVALLAAERGSSACRSADRRAGLLLAASPSPSRSFALVSLVGNQALFAGREALRAA